MNNQSVKHVGGGFNPKPTEKSKIAKKPKYIIKHSEERRDSLKENMRKIIGETPEKNLKMSCINSLS